MRFFFLCHNYPGYGTFFRAFQLARHLVKAGHSVVLMLVSRNESFRVKRYDRGGVWIIECPNFQPLIADKEDGWGPLDILLRCAYGLTHRFDVVVGFGHKPDIAIPALLLKYFKMVMFIADWCDLWGDGGIFSVRGLLRPEMWGSHLDRILVRAETFLEKLAVRRADGVTVICAFFLEMCEKMGIPRRKVLLLRSGCDTEGIKPLDKRAARKELGLPDGRILEYLGNYHQEAALLFRAFRVISSSRDDIYLLIVGPRYPDTAVEDDGHPTEGKRIFLQLPEGVRTKIIWAGKRKYEELPRYLAAADILLLPMEATLLEAGRWPNKISDYLASGRPIAATDVGDAGRFIRDNGCGIVTPSAIENYCEALLANIDNEDFLARAGAASRLVAERDLSWQNITEKFLQFVDKSILENKKGNSKMRKALPKLMLAAYTIIVIIFEGAYLLIAWAAIKLGWVPKKKER